MKQNIQNINIATIYIWIGFVCAISFMEAWLKFQAPGINTKLGLGIGKLVFNALNKVELACAIITLLLLLKTRKQVKSKSFYTNIGIPLGILTLQSLWILPHLDARATSIINNIPVQASNTHIFFVLLEIIKVVCLNLFGIQLFKNK